MKKWEYLFQPAVSPADISKVHKRFETLGNEGWELVCFEYGYAIFKREVIDEH